MKFKNLIEIIKYQTCERFVFGFVYKTKKAKNSLWSRGSPLQLFWIVDCVSYFHIEKDT